MRCNVATAPKGLDLRERVIWVINDFVGTWRKYPYLEQRTGISARKWQNVCHRNQQPSLEMVCALAEYRPHLFTWMMLGYDLNTQQSNPEIEGWQKNFDEHDIERFASLSIPKTLRREKSKNEIS